jgi:hypothetical protein
MSEIDREALLVALVLAPATYSRNRFFSLYTDPEIRRIRRRASLIRGIVRHVSRVDAEERGEVVRTEPTDAGRVDFIYAVPAIGLRRTATLDPIELSLVRFAMSRAPGRSAPLAPDDPDRLRIEAALQRLAPRAIPPSAPPV